MVEDFGSIHEFINSSRYKISGPHKEPTKRLYYKTLLLQ